MRKILCSLGEIDSHAVLTVKTLQPIKQLARLHAKSRSKFEDVLQADVPLAPLNPPDVVPMEFGSLREALLRPATAEAEFPDYLSKLHLWVGVRRHHSHSH
jgi:hypothetical protein